MRKFSLSVELVEHTLGLLALGFMAAGILLYALQEPQRIANAQTAIRNTNLDEAMTLYAQNCSICHGLSGEGIGATPALDSEALRSADTDSLTKIIARGLYGTTMPAWSQEDGGTLSDYQISVLVEMIQYGNWQQTQERVVNLGLAPLVPFAAEPDATMLEQVTALPGGVVNQKIKRVHPHFM